jgi:hypothetical protein
MALKQAELHDAITQLTSDPECEQCQEFEAKGYLEMMPQGVCHSYMANKRQLQDLRELLKTIAEWRQRKTQDIGYVAAASGFRRRLSTTMTAPPGQPRESCLDWAPIDI